MWLGMDKHEHILGCWTGRFQGRFRTSNNTWCCPSRRTCQQRERQVCSSLDTQNDSKISPYYLVSLFQVAKSWRPVVGYIHTGIMIRWGHPMLLLFLLIFWHILSYSQITMIRMTSINVYNAINVMIHIECRPLLPYSSINYKTYSMMMYHGRQNNIS